MSSRVAGHVLLILLVLGTLPCEVTVEAERGDQEAVVVCTLLDHWPDWLPLSRVARHHGGAAAVKRAAHLSFRRAARIFSLSIISPAQ